MAVRGLRSSCEKGEGEITHFVARLHDQRLAEAAVGHPPRGCGELTHRSGEAKRDEAVGGDGGEQAASQSHQHHGPRAVLEGAHGDLGPAHFRRGVLGQLGQRPVQLLGGRARRAFRDRHGPRRIALAEERALLVDVLLIAREGGHGLAIARHLRHRREERVQAAEVRHRALRALLQEIAVGTVAQDEIARFEAEEPRHHLLQGDFDLQSGQGAIGDLAMRPHQVIDGEEAPRRDAHQGHDDQGCRGEEF